MRSARGVSKKQRTSSKPLGDITLYYLSENAYSPLMLAFEEAQGERDQTSLRLVECLYMTTPKGKDLQVSIQGRELRLFQRRSSPSLRPGSKYAAPGKSIGFGEKAMLEQRVSWAKQSYTVVGVSGPLRGTTRSRDEAFYRQWKESVRQLCQSGASFGSVVTRLSDTWRLSPPTRVALLPVWSTQEARPRAAGPDDGFEKKENDIKRDDLYPPSPDTMEDWYGTGTKTIQPSSTGQGQAAQELVHYLYGEPAGSRGPAESHVAPVLDELRELLNKTQQCLALARGCLLRRGPDLTRTEVSGGATAGLACTTRRVYALAVASTSHNIKNKNPNQRTQMTEPVVFVATRASGRASRTGTAVTRTQKTATLPRLPQRLHTILRLLAIIEFWFYVATCGTLLLSDRYRTWLAIRRKSKLFHVLISDFAGGSILCFNRRLTLWLYRGLASETNCGGTVSAQWWLWQLYYYVRYERLLQWVWSQTHVLLMLLLMCEANPPPLPGSVVVHLIILPGLTYLSALILILFSIAWFRPDRQAWALVGRTLGALTAAWLLYAWVCLLGATTRRDHVQTITAAYVTFATSVMLILIYCNSSAKNKDRVLYHPVWVLLTTGCDVVLVSQIFWYVNSLLLP
eukprot:g47966.t1